MEMLCSVHMYMLQAPTLTVHENVEQLHGGQLETSVVAIGTG